MAEPVLSNIAPSDPLDETARIRFVLRSVLSGVRTSLPVRVISVTNSGGDAPIGFVSVQPLVGALDGNGSIIEHGILNNVPYSRLQGGSNAIILDPEVGDIGLASVCDRDISSVKHSGVSGGPGSLRRYDLSDMVYLLSIIGAVPTQYIQFSSAGINVVSPNPVQVTAQSAVIKVTGSATIQAASAIIQAGSIALQNSGTALKALLNALLVPWLSGHVHSNGNAGANTGVPTTQPAANTQTTVVTAE